MRRAIAIVGGMMFSLVLTGCQFNASHAITPQVVASTLLLAGEKGSQYGLQKWAQTEQAPAIECATALRKNVNDVLLPYLNQGQLPASNLVRDFINSSLFVNVNQKIKDTIIMASVALDALLPAPAANTYLNANQILYVKSFMTGISNGCNKFLTSVGVKEVDRKVPINWLK